MANPGSIPGRVPYGADGLMRKQGDLRRQVQQNAAARSLAASQIGNGGTLLVAGSLQVTGSITVPGTLASAGAVSAGTTVSAGTDVTAGGNLNGVGVNVSGIIRSPATYTNSITSSFRAVWVTSVDGSFGYNLSSGRYKQDIADLIEDPALVLKLRLVTFRYIAAVEEFGDDAATEVGLIAEEVDELGLKWLVDYGEDGKPETLKFHLLAMAVLLVAQNHEDRIAALEATTLGRPATNPAPR